MIQTAWKLFRLLGWIGTFVSCIMLWVGMNHLSITFMGYTLLGLGQCLFLISMIPNAGFWLILFGGFLIGITGNRTHRR